MREVQSSVGMARHSLLAFLAAPVVIEGLPECSYVGSASSRCNMGGLAYMNGVWPSSLGYYMLNATALGLRPTASVSQNTGKEGVLGLGVLQPLSTADFTWTPSLENPFAPYPVNVPATAWNNTNREWTAVVSTSSAGMHTAHIDQSVINLTSLSVFRPWGNQLSIRLNYGNIGFEVSVCRSGGSAAKECAGNLYQWMCRLMPPDVCTPTVTTPSAPASSVSAKVSAQYHSLGEGECLSAGASEMHPLADTPPKCARQCALHNTELTGSGGSRCAGFQIDEHHSTTGAGGICIIFLNSPVYLKPGTASTGWRCYNLSAVGSMGQPTAYTGPSSSPQSPTESPHVGLKLADGVGCAAGSGCLRGQRATMSSIAPGPARGNRCYPSFEYITLLPPQSPCGLYISDDQFDRIVTHLPVLEDAIDNVDADSVVLTDSLHVDVGDGSACEEPKQQAAASFPWALGILSLLVVSILSFLIGMLIDRRCFPPPPAQKRQAFKISMVDADHMPMVGNGAVFFDGNTAEEAYLNPVGSRRGQADSQFELFSVAPRR